MSVRKQSNDEPAFRLDLTTASSKAFFETITKFYEWSEQQQPVGPLEIESGWHEVTWQMAEDFLRRNVCNRCPSLSHVLKLHYDMQNGNWRRTGQGLVFNTDGKLNEGQQRCLAAYFGLLSFKTYIVTDAPADEPDLFAFYDDVKPRSAADALQTSGLNGIAGPLAAAVHLSDRYERDMIGILKQPKMRKLNNREVLAYSKDHPSLSETGHIIFSNYPKAVSVLDNKAAAIVFADRVISLYGQSALDDFFTPLGTGANLEEDNPILGLRNRLLNEDKINKERVLALTIKAFNWHRQNKKLSAKGLFVRDNEKFPKLEAAFEFGE